MAEDPDAEFTPQNPEPNPDAGDVDGDAEAEKAEADKAAAAEKAEADKKAEAAKEAGDAAKPEKKPAKKADADADALPAFLSEIKNPDARKLAARFVDVDAFANGHLEMVRKRGEMISLPGDDASDDELKEFRSKMGVPDDATGQLELIQSSLPEDFEPTDVDERFQTAIADVFHKARVTSEQAPILAEGYQVIADEILNMQRKSDEEFAAESEAALLKRWGKNNDRMRAAAHTFLNDSRIFPDPTAAMEIETSDGRMLLDHPIIAEAFANAGLLVLEDPLRAGLPSSEKQTLQEELDGLMKTDDYWENETVQNRVKEINEILHGNEPIVGEGGRTF